MVNRNRSLLTNGSNATFNFIPTIQGYTSDELMSSFDQLIDELVHSKHRPRLKEIFQTNSKFPSLEVSRDKEKENLILTLIVSGYNKENISIEYDPKRQGIVVVGSKKEISEDDKQDIYYSEIKRSNFERIIPVNQNHISNLDGITSSIEDGILTIKIPYEFEDKKIEKARRKITIN